MKAFLIAILLLSGCNDPMFSSYDGNKSDTVIVVSKTYYFDGREPQLVLEKRPKDWYARLFENGTKVVYKDTK